jgi:hypothetical protein
MAETTMTSSAPWGRSLCFRGQAPRDGKHNPPNLELAATLVLRVCDTGLMHTGVVDEG